MACRCRFLSREAGSPSIASYCDPEKFGSRVALQRCQSKRDGVRGSHHHAQQRRASQPAAMEEGQVPRPSSSTLCSVSQALVIICFRLPSLTLIVKQIYWAVIDHLRPLTLYHDAPSPISRSRTSLSPAFRATGDAHRPHLTHPSTVAAKGEGTCIVSARAGCLSASHHLDLPVTRTELIKRARASDALLGNNMPCSASSSHPLIFVRATQTPPLTRRKSYRNLLSPSHLLPGPFGGSPTSPV
jgi:hypothetical protein